MIPTAQRVRPAETRPWVDLDIDFSPKAPCQARDSSRLPAVVEGVVEDSTVSVRQVDRFVRGTSRLLINDSDSKPDTMLQALLPASLVALVPFGVWLAVWTFLPITAILLFLIAAGFYTGLLKLPEHPAKSTAGFVGTMLWVIGCMIMFPARGVVHCCCGLVGR